MSAYNALIKKRAELNPAEREAMAELYLTYYDNADRDLFFRDLDAKTEVDILYCGEKTVGFSTLLVYESEWKGRPVRIVYSGDTIVHREHWGQQALSSAWLKHMGTLASADSSKSCYWFLLVKGHRTYRFLPAFARAFHPDFRGENAPLKEFADRLALDKFGDGYNSRTGVVEFEKSMGNLKEEIAFPTARELRNPDVRFFLQRNPGYLEGHELVCLCEIAPHNLKPFARRIFAEGFSSGKEVGGHARTQAVRAEK